MRYVNLRHRPLFHPQWAGPPRQLEVAPTPTRSRLHLVSSAIPTWALDGAELSRQEWRQGLGSDSPHTLGLVSMTSDTVPPPRTHTKHRWQGTGSCFPTQNCRTRSFFLEYNKGPPPTRASRRRRPQIPLKAAETAWGQTSLPQVSTPSSRGNPED